MTVSPIHSLAARYYTDPQIFAAERAGVLASTWTFSRHSSQLPNTSDYFSFEMAGEILIAIKGRDG